MKGRPLSQRELRRAGDNLISQVEEANLAEDFSPALAHAVHKFEFLVHFEGGAEPPKEPPANGGEAHSRLMGVMGFLVTGEIYIDEERLGETLDQRLRHFPAREAAS